MSKEGDGSILVSLQTHSPDLLSSLRSAQKLLRNSSQNYFPSGAVAARLGVTPQGLSRITGSLWVNSGIDRYEIGLAVKLGSKNMCVAGYVRPSPNGTGWEYTDALTRMLESYKNTFSWVFDAVDATPEGGEICLRQVFAEMSETELTEMASQTRQWLDQLPLHGRPLVSVPLYSLARVARISCSGRC